MYSAPGALKGTASKGQISGRVVRPDSSRLFTPRESAVQQSPICDDRVSAALHGIYAAADAAKKATEKLQTEIEEQQTRFLEVASANAEKQSEVNMALKALESLELRRRAALDARSKLLVKQQQLTTAAQRQSELVDRLTTKAADNTAVRDSDRMRLGRTNNAITVLKDALDKAAAEAVELAQQKREIEPQIKEAQVRATELASAVSKAQTEVRLALQQLMEAREAVVKAVEGEGSVAADRAATEKFLEQQLETIGDMEAKQAMLAGVIELTSHQVTDATGKLDAAKGLNARLTDSATNLKGNLTALSKELATAQAALAARRSSLADLTQKTDALTRQVEDFTHRYTQVLADLETLAKDTTATALADGAAAARLSALAVEVAAKEGEYKAGVAAMNVLNKNVSAAQAELTSLDMKRAGIEQTTLAVTGDTAKLDRESKQLSQAKVLLEEEIAKLTARADAARKKMYAAMRRIKAHRAAELDLLARQRLLIRRGDCDASPGSPECDVSTLRQDYAALLDAVVNGRAEPVLQDIQDEEMGRPTRAQLLAQEKAAAAAKGNATAKAGASKAPGAIATVAAAAAAGAGSKPAGAPPAPAPAPPKY